MKKLNKKKITIVTCVALLVGFGVTMFAVGGAQSEDVSADVATVTVDGKEITVDKDGNEVKVNKDGEVEIVEKDAVSKEEATKAVESNKKDSNKSNTSNSNSTKPSSSNKNNNSNSGSSGNSSSNKDNDSTKPTTHTHDWVAVYATKQVQVGTERKCVDSIMVCVCGARNISYEHTYAHLDAGEPNNTWVEEIWETVPIYETQKYVDYYKCSCGATK